MSVVASCSQHLSPPPINTTLMLGPHSYLLGLSFQGLFEYCACRAYGCADVWSQVLVDLDGIFCGCAIFSGYSNTDQGRGRIIAVTRISLLMGKVSTLAPHAGRPPDKYQILRGCISHCLMERRLNDLCFETFPNSRFHRSEQACAIVLQVQKHRPLCMISSVPVSSHGKTSFRSWLRRAFAFFCRNLCVRSIVCSLWYHLIIRCC